MRKIRWGIVGAGNIAHKFAVAIKNVDTAELVAVASRTAEKGKEFSEKYGVKTVFSTYEAMAESDVVDAVYIATPHPFHSSGAKLFLNAKKHVLCEKPLCVNASLAMELKACAEQNGVFLMEAMWTRFLPAINEIEKIVEDGVIGDILSLSADFCYRSTPDEEGKLFDNSMAGGSILDVGIYGLHFASIFLGDDPEEICSSSQIEYGVDVQTSIVLKYKNGAIANVSSAITVAKPESAYIYGTKGYIHIPTFYGATDFYIYKDGKENHIKKPSIGDGFEEEIYESCRCILEGKLQSDINPLDKTITILKQMDLVRKQNGIKYPFDLD